VNRVVVLEKWYPKKEESVAVGHDRKITNRSVFILANIIQVVIWINLNPNLVEHEENWL
jgi:hypothetical protein